MEFFLSLCYYKKGYFSNGIISQWIKVLNIDLRICSNSNFVWPQNIPVISKISKLVWGFSALESQAVWAPWLSQSLFIAYILAVGSSNPSLVHSLIVWQLNHYVRTIRNHKQTYAFFIQAALIWLVHSNTKNQDYHLFILIIPL
jgi:hypothetical protein